jgi:uncharacterized repeat protein (TIGR01451 family)
MPISRRFAASLVDGLSRRILGLSLLAFMVVVPDGKGQVAAVRRPRGIYTVVDIDSYIALLQSENRSITTAQLHDYFNKLYPQLLGNPAVSGLTIQIGWARLNPNDPSSPQAYDWSYLDDAFTAASAWNAQNPAATPETIEVQVFPGYFTPSWLLAEIPSCDGLFQSPVQTPPSNCGEATFADYNEPHDGLTVLPMPWNPVYTSAYQTFLTAFAARYLPNPLFVSMDVGGPTAASTEMIVPNDNNTPDQSQFGNITPGDMWKQLLTFAYPNQPSYQDSDQAFIDAWNAAIDMFGQIFPGITLIAWTGDGLLNLSTTGFAVPPGFAADCPVVNMDCAAETTILSHFSDPTVAAASAKASGEEGLNGIPFPSQFNLNPRWLSQTTAPLTSPSAQVLAGFQFGTSFADDPVGEGCTVKFPPDFKNPPASCTIPPTCTTQGCLPGTCIPQACLAPGITVADLSAMYNQVSDVPAKDFIPPEQAAFNVLKNFFQDTAGAPLFGGTAGAAPENHLQIYDTDIQYANAHANDPVPVIQSDGTSVLTTAQDLLNLASQTISEIAEPAAADLIVAKSHTGNFTQGQSNATYTVNVSNEPGAGPTSGIVTVTETVPAGLTLVSMAGTNWTCTGATCSDSDVLTGGQSYPPITVTVNVVSSAPAQVINQVAVSGGGSPTANAADPTMVYPAGGHPDFFSGEASLGSGVYYLQFPDNNLFGYYNYVASSIFYHYDMGYEGFLAGSASDLYLYDFASNHWWYTSSTLFPYLYDFTLNAWLYYFPNTKEAGHYTTNPRYFSNLKTGMIFTM